MPLSDVEVRVLGALVEKERTTPDAYPLSVQGLVTACNQRTSRDPVMDLHLQEVQGALQRLRDRGMAATVQEVSDRVPKHRHLLVRALDLDDRQLAVLAVLMLRGAQTPGELRGRTERYLDVGDVAAVESVLASLADRAAPLVKNLGRGPGQSQDRWTHLLTGDEERLQPRVRRDGVRGEGEADGETRGTAPGSSGSAPRPAVGAPAPGGGAPGLEARLAELERRVAALERSLGSMSMEESSAKVGDERP